MNNLNIGSRLLVAFSILVLLILGISLYSYSKLSTIKEQADSLAQANAKVLSLVAENAKDHAEQARKQADSSYAQALSAYESATGGLVLGCGLAVIVAIAGALLITRSIVSPLRKMIAVMRDIAEGEGDLTKNIYLDSADELGELSKWFDMFMDNIQEDITNIGKSTHQIAAASVQLHSTAEQIAMGSKEVAMQAERVASAGQGMSDSSGNIAQNCSQAADGSHRASEAAVAGARVVDETIAVMNSIAIRVKETATTVATLGNRSEQIGQIVGTIQEIADQTNLLALNAAIEAARAGEQGRGFAVVADEVRKLAERTRKATSEISEMIKTIQSETSGAVSAMEIGVNEVVQGSEKATESGQALGRIQEQINLVTTQINHVAKAANEQTTATLEISNNMHQITEVVARTSSGAQETTKAADQLAALAKELDRIVGQFKV